MPLRSRHPLRACWTPIRVAPEEWRQQVVRTGQATLLLPLLTGWAVALDCSAGTWAPVGCLMEGTFTVGLLSCPVAPLHEQHLFKHKSRSWCRGAWPCTKTMQVAWTDTSARFGPIGFLALKTAPWCLSAVSCHSFFSSLAVSNQHLWCAD